VRDGRRNLLRQRQLVPGDRGQGIDLRTGAFTSGEGVYDVRESLGHKPFKIDEHVAAGSIAP